MKAPMSIICILFLFFLLNNSASAQAFADLETGAVFTGYNHVRIPGDQGTRFSLKDDLHAGTTIFYRLRAGYMFNPRHSLSLLYAPLETRSDGRVERDISFQGVLFPANTPIDGLYKFNSYRLTYRYEIVNKPGFAFGLGFTAKIRDAKIRLAAPGLSAGKTNVGFVPIINFRLWWQVDNRLGLLFEGDALAAPQGRAEDVQLAATYKFSDRLGIRAGYRILEGGADNARVYNFALFHYASLGITYTFVEKAR